MFFGWYRPDIWYQTVLIGSKKPFGQWSFCRIAPPLAVLLQWCSHRRHRFARTRRSFSASYWVLKWASCFSSFCPRWHETQWRSVPSPASQLCVFVWIITPPFCCAALLCPHFRHEAQFSLSRLLQSFPTLFSVREWGGGVCENKKSLREIKADIRRFWFCNNAGNHSGCFIFFFLLTYLVQFSKSENGLMFIVSECIRSQAFAVFVKLRVQIAFTPFIFLVFLGLPKLMR